MTYNQKMISVLTMFAVGITTAITFVMFDAPYSQNFLIAYGMLSFSEILFGAFWVCQISRADSVLPLSLGVWVINAMYFLFTFAAIFFTSFRSERYILLHSVSFAIFVMAHILFRMAEHHAEKMSEDDEPQGRIERAKVTWR